jgi:hypothetical protein
MRKGGAHGWEWSWPIALLLPLLFALNTRAQSMEQWIAWGDAAMARGEHYGASRFYAGALEREPGRMALQWKMAEACRLSNQYDKAADLYDRVYRKDQGRTYPECLRWLGEMQLCDAQYTEAERTWRRVQQRSKDPVLKERARNALTGIELARTPAADTLVVEHLPAPLNTFDSEFGARIGPDGLLYFSSLRGELNDDEEVVDTADYQVRIHHSKPVPGAWAEGIPMPLHEGSGHAANAAWSSDGKLFFHTRCGPNGPCRIHHGPADGMDLISTPLEGLGDAMSTQPMVVEHAGRTMLYFVSDRDGGMGGMDIWTAELKDGQATDVRPLGPPVNTPGNECTPWFDALSGTLWFSSDFHPGLGGYDIFRSTLRGDGFSAPVNAGAPINSPANDLYPALYPERGEGWLTSNRKGSFAAKGATCCNDLYRFTIEAPKPAPVLPADTIVQEHLVALRAMQRRPPIRLFFHNDEPDPRTRKRTTTKTYGATYTAYKALQAEYERESGTPEDIRAFFHDEVDHGHNELHELTEALRAALEAGEQITLEVRGHASPLAVNDYNHDLSMRRISSLRNHLRTVHGGVFAAYMDSSAANGGILRIRALPFGEDRSQKGVSDDLADLRGSVYSVAAARERRIEIERIVIEEGEPTAYALPSLRRGVPLVLSVPVHNTGDTPLRFVHGRVECDCFLVRELPDEIAPRATGHIQVEFTGRAQPGPIERIIVLEVEDTDKPVELRVRGVVSE